jgi:branched-chain amino acid transport system permease protein
MRESQNAQRTSTRELVTTIGLLGLFLLAIINGPARLESLGTLALIYIVCAFGLHLLYGSTGLLSMAQVGLMSSGAFTAGYLSFVHSAPFLACLAAGTVVAALGGAVVALPSLRAHGHYFLIVTFLFTVLIQVVATNWTWFTGGVYGRSIVEPVLLFGFEIDLPRNRFLFLFAVACGSAVVVFLIRRSTFGQLLVAIRENEQLGTSLGLRSFPLKVAAFAVAGAFAGLAGALYAFHLRYILSDNFGLDLALLIVTVLLIGGARRLEGPVIGAFLVVFLPDFLHFDPAVNTGVNGALLIVAVLALPGGLVSIPTLVSTRVQARRARRDPALEGASDA